MIGNTHLPDDPVTEPDEHRPTASWSGAPFLFAGPLQTVSVERTQTSPVELVLLVVLLAVGSLLTYHAFRGYRRNDDRSMAVFAVGLCMLTVVHAGLKLAAEFVIPPLFGSGQAIIIIVAATSQLVDVIGLLVVFYAILR